MTTTMTDNMWRLAIGQPYDSTVSSWPERSEYRIFGGNHLLQVCAGNLSPGFVERFQTAPIRLGLYVQEGVVFVLFRIDGCYDWSDQALHMQLLPAEDRSADPYIPGTHQILSVVLVNADNGLVEAIRVVTWSKHGSELLLRKLNAQLDDDAFTPERHQAIIDRVYRQYPHSAKLAKASLVIEKAGGAQ